MGTKLPLLQKPRRRLGQWPPEAVTATTTAPTEDPDDPSAAPPDPELSKTQDHELSKTQDHELLKTPDSELSETPELPEVQPEDTWC